MKFLRKIKPSRMLRRSPGGYAPPATQGALLKLEEVEVKRPGKPPTIEEHMVLYATNGYGFVRLDLGVKERMDEPGPIPAQALRHLEKGVQADLGIDEIRMGITHYERVFTETNPGVEPPTKFPDMIETLRRVGALKSDPAGSNYLSVNINPRLLLDMAEALGHPTDVKLTFDLRLAKLYSPKKKKRFYSGPFRMQPPDDFYRDPQADGYLMPIKPIGHPDVDASGGAFK